jgi:hypothetical protein
MQQEFDEEWEINVGNKMYIINRKQYDIIKDVILKGFKKIIFFDKMAINVSHISAMNYVEGSKRVKNRLDSGKIKDISLSSEESRKKIAEMKKKLMEKYKIL